MQTICPGSALIKSPTPEDITCPFCGTKVEIWTDERKTKCLNCGGNIMREMTQNCVDWCPKARECLGEAKYKEYMEQKKTAEAS
jgi:DNA-directed RNA polymerase subunit RPC12/RpoP